MSVDDENSWGAQRALVMNKLDEVTTNQKELTALHHTLSESVVAIKVKLGFMVAGISIGVSTVMSTIVGVIATVIGAK